MYVSIILKLFLSEIDTCAKALKAQGIKKGDAVTVCLPNVPQAIIMFYAINRIGAVASMIHPLSAENEILFYLNEVKSKLAITLSKFYSKFEAIKGKTRVEKVIVAKIGEVLPTVKSIAYKLVGNEPKVKDEPGVISWPDFMKKGKNSPKEISHEGNGDEDAVILFSGGTTGTSKGILHRNLNFNALAYQIKESARCYDAGDTMLSVMPVFHGFGLGISIHAMLIHGVRCVLVPQLNVKEFAGYIKKYRPNIMAGVPTLFEAMMRNEDMKKSDLSCLKGIFSGGESLSVELKKKVDAFIRERGATVQVREGYGTTECVAASCIVPKDYYREGSIGLSFPDTYYKIVIPSTLDEAPTGQMGEICISVAVAERMVYGRRRITKEMTMM